MLTLRNKQDNIAINNSNSNDPISSLLSVQINTTELCNRTCSFCPRVDPNVYPNRNLHISLELIEKISIDLADIKFKGRISLSGFGEPLLHKKFLDIIETIRNKLPNNIIDVNTNGDTLDEDMIQSLYNSGLSLLYVNLYDGPEQIAYYTDMFKNIDNSKYILREHFDPKNNYNLILNNRGGSLHKIEKQLQRKCYFPFSKAMIDYNGDLLLCPQDWFRKYIIGSLYNNSVRELWLSENMKKIRLLLSEGNRSLEPCNQCDVNGTLTGEYGYNLLMNHYNQ